MLIKRTIINGEYINFKTVFTAKQILVLIYKHFYSTWIHILLSHHLIWPYVNTKFTSFSVRVIKVIINWNTSWPVEVL